MVIWAFSLFFFQSFRGFGREGKSLVNLGASLIKQNNQGMERQGVQCVFEGPFAFVQKQGASARFRAKKRIWLHFLDARGFFCRNFWLEKAQSL